MNTQSLRLLNALPPLEALVCFEAVARCGSFTRAALELSITQSAVSKQIKGLEEALRCTLFDRHARGIELSATGASFLEELEPLLYKLQRAVSRIQHEHDTQAISIACTQAVAHFWLFPRVVRFNQTYPDIAVNMVSSNAINERRCSDCDFGILYGDGDWPSLEGTRLFPEIVYPICSPELSVPHPEAAADLCSLPLIQLDSRAWDCIDWQDWFKHYGLSYDPPRNAITFNQVTLVFNAALEGLGVCLGWDYMAHQAIESGKLRRLGDFAFETGRWDYLVHAKHRPLTRPARTFHDWLVSSASLPRVAAA